MTDTIIKIPLDEIETTCRDALLNHGANAEAAAHVANAVRVAESKSNLICGLYYMESYCQQLRSGRVKGDVQPIVSQPKSACVAVDAGFGFAQPAFAKALPLAVETAGKTGVCSLAVCHAHTCTALGYFTEQIARAGLIGIGFTNASAVVAPPNGNRGVIGTNPIAMSVPDKDGGVCFQFDQSTSAVALGKITMAAAAGESIPLGWAVDAQGQGTTDPAAALKGALVSAGGYKGWGIGLMVEVMAAAFTGSVASTQVKALKSPDGAPHDLGQSYVLLDPEVFAGDAFWTRLDEVVGAVEVQDGARLPGRSRVRGRVDAGAVESVEIDAALWDKIKRLGGSD